MAYSVFISHSTKDRGLVIALAHLLEKFGARVFVAEWYLSPGTPLDKKISEQINKSDCMVVLLTRSGIRSNWVQQEVGYAVGAGKTIIPLVEKGTGTKDLGALQGREYIEYDISEPMSALSKVSDYIKHLKLKKEQKENTLLVLGGITALLLLLSGEKR
ncbi:MAG: toll/interleukin-1 receptor domain-containing protein [Thermodesulfovibrionales bacterium]|nr:toll/interleukin-1 receptor domain-containing protein [Thermodesulfovibrionales bacterium]